MFNKASVHTFRSYSELVLATVGQIKMFEKEALREIGFFVFVSLCFVFFNIASCLVALIHIFSRGMNLKDGQTKSRRGLHRSCFDAGTAVFHVFTEFVLTVKIKTIFCK